MIDVALNLLGHGLSIANERVKNKYLDKYLDLKERYHEAINQPDELWDDAVIDDIEFELRQLAEGFTSFRE